ncbi:MAG: hypothetical protein J7K33_06135 [Candidatus Marinimicrobia bacterium]|nr:hypothetical protein [Candidatus Neomarinimicrobiota bacterium]
MDPDGSDVKIHTTANTPKGFKENFLKIVSTMHVYHLLNKNPFILVEVWASTGFQPSDPSAGGEFLPSGSGFREAPGILKALGSIGAFIWGREFGGSIKYKSSVIEKIASGNFSAKEIAIIFHEFTHALLEYETKGDFWGGSMAAEEVEVYKRMLAEYGDQLTAAERKYWEDVLREYERKLEEEKQD